MGTGSNPKESTTEKIPPSRFSGSVRVKWRGKSPPASGRPDGLANPIRCKAKEGTAIRGEDGPSFNPGRPQEARTGASPAEK